LGINDADSEISRISIPVLLLTCGLIEKAVNDTDFGQTCGAAGEEQPATIRIFNSVRRTFSRMHISVVSLLFMAVALHLILVKLSCTKSEHLFWHVFLCT
jgi:hypothetical protein